MIVDHEALMKWAKEQAPLKRLSRPGNENYREFVRLEIAAEFEWVDDDCSVENDHNQFIVVARTYLREPRCMHHPLGENVYHKICEYNPLAEKRLA